MKERRPYPTDVSDEEWYFAAPYLTLMNKDAPQRRYELREMFNALQWIVRAGAPWRLLPNDFPPWELLYQQTQRWIQAGCFEAMVNDLRSIIRVAQGRRGQPSAVILDGRTLQSTCESGPRAEAPGSAWRAATSPARCSAAHPYVGLVHPGKQPIHLRQCFVRHHADRTQRMRVRNEVVQLTLGNQTLGERVGAPRMISKGQVGAFHQRFRDLRDDVTAGTSAAC